MDLTARRRFFAEEIEAVARLQTARLVDALASIPRESFLPAGPWTIVSDFDYGGGPAAVRSTPDADPARVYHNIGVAIDPQRQLFNGQPATLAAWIDALRLTPAARVLHVGCGTGYYSAVMAHIVRAGGRIVACEADEDLARIARTNLAGTPWVEVRSTSSADPAGEQFDAVLVNAGVTHPLPSWLNALAPGGRLLMPLTMTMGPSARVGKGIVVLVTRTGDATFAARTMGMVMIFSASGLRDERLGPALGNALMGGPTTWGRVVRLRMDPHAQADSCWYHGTEFCFSQ